jgi:hypothetical protein
MIDAKECRTEAAKYDALALEARDEETKAALLRLANHWRDLEAKARRANGAE